VKKAHGRMTRMARTRNVVATRTTHEKGGGLLKYPINCVAALNTSLDTLKISGFNTDMMEVVVVVCGTEAKLYGLCSGGGGSRVLASNPKHLPFSSIITIGCFMVAMAYISILLGRVLF